MTAGRAIVAVLSDRDGTFLAAGIAYYAFVSVFPAVLLAVAITTAIGDEMLAAAVLDRSGQYLSPGGQELLVSAIRTTGGRGSATLVGIVALLWSTLKVFRGLDIAFSRIYGTQTAESFLTRIVDALIVLVSITIAIGTMVIGGGLLAVQSPSVGRGLLGLFVLLIGLVVVFLPIYYFFPDTDVSVTEVLPGTVIAAAGWVLLQALFQLYAGITTTTSLYGVIGGVLLLVTWFYFAAILLVLGAAVNVVLAGRIDAAVNRQLQHT